MNQWIVEDWRFTVTVMDGISKNCRLGFEKAINSIVNTKSPPAIVLKQHIFYILYCEIISMRRDFKNKGSDKEYEIDFPCADGMILFHLVAEHV